MIVYYAMGGGLGHLTRGRRVLESLGIDATFVTSSPYARDPRVVGSFPVIEVPADLQGDVDAHRTFLRSLNAERFLVDTFPCGIQGELSGLDVPMDLVARPLKWAEYRRAVPHPLPRFERVWRSECGVRQRQLPLSIAPAAAGAAEIDSGDWRRRTPYWLIVHSGPEHEVRELVAYAQELHPEERVLVATQCEVELPRGFERIDEYPVAHRFPHATCIISAAGFNVMLETEPYRDKHHVLPFARKFDDQFARAAARKRFAAKVVTP